MVPLLFAWTRKIVYHLHLRAMQPFEEIWVPDEQGENSLRGDLSQRYPIPDRVRFIGALSRFSNHTPPPAFSLSQLNEKTPDIVAILSGPEPQRSLLEEKIWTQAQQQDRAVWIIGGKPEAEGIEWKGPHARIPFLATEDLHRLLLQAKLVISRSGYSSLMDYEALGLNKLVLIPTPGQTEQEYLAKSLAAKGKAITRKQSRFRLKEVLRSAKES
jgi:predicted glycosyltransferase